MAMGLLIVQIFVVIGVINCLSYNVVDDYKCIKIHENEIVNLKKVAGVWHQMASSKFLPTPPSKCSTAYTTYYNNNTLGIRSEIFDYYGEKPFMNWLGLITEGGPSQIQYINFEPSNKLQIYYFKKFTDYNLYDIVYGCTSLNNVYQGTMILMTTRTCPYTEEAFSAAKDRLAEHGIQQDWIVYNGKTCCGK